MNMSKDPVLLQYLQQAEDDIAVTKYLYNLYLENKVNGESHASQYLDTTVTKFLNQAADDVAVTKYLGTASTRFLETA